MQELMTAHLERYVLEAQAYLAESSLAKGTKSAVSDPTRQKKPLVK